MLLLSPMITGISPKLCQRLVWEHGDARSPLLHTTSSHLTPGISSLINTLRPRQNGRHFADDTFKRIFLNENNKISIKISLKFVPKGPINKIPALVQIMAWRRPGDKPLSEPMLDSSTALICVTRPQWVKPAAMEQLMPLPTQIHSHVIINKYRHPLNEQKTLSFQVQTINRY